MKFGPVPLAEAEGEILGHNFGTRQGKSALRKGQRLSSADLNLLETMGKEIVYVAQLDESDLDEDEAARRVALASHGAGTVPGGPANGRVNVRAEYLGVLRVDNGRLARLNSSDGVTLATLPADRLIHPRRIISTVKVIPYAVPQSTVQDIEGDSERHGPLLWVDAVEARSVGLILAGPEAEQASLLAQFSPLIERVEALGSALQQMDIVPDDEEIAQGKLAEALSRQRAAGVELILLAGQTAVMDRQDIAPRAIEAAGGSVEVVGAPVDPGNLLMLGYLDTIPVLGAPGCARSRKTNVVDWVLPRLLAGERLAKTDIVALGLGGLLEDVPERPMPRDRAG